MMRRGGKANTWWQGCNQSQGEGEHEWAKKGDQKGAPLPLITDMFSIASLSQNEECVCAQVAAVSCCSIHVQGIFFIPGHAKHGWQLWAWKGKKGEQWLWPWGWDASSTHLWCQCMQSLQKCQCCQVNTASHHLWKFHLLLLSLANPSPSPMPRWNPNWVCQRKRPRLTHMTVRTWAKKMTGPWSSTYLWHLQGMDVQGEVWWTRWRSGWERRSCQNRSRQNGGGVRIGSPLYL